MVIEVRYQTKNDAADPHSHFERTEFFEVDEIPDSRTIAEQLKRMGKDFAESTISISEYEEKDANAMRRGGLRVIKLSQDNKTKRQTRE